MARKKDPPKPLLSLKFDFVESLDNLTQQAVNMVQMVELVVDHGNLPAPVKEKLAEQLAKFKAALFQEGE